MDKKKMSIGAVIGFCGACIAFYIGAGFATMQEVMQYDVAYGSLFWVVVLVAMGIYAYTNLSFATNGNRLHLTRGGDIYQHYCGKYIGKFFTYCIEKGERGGQKLRNRAGRGGLFIALMLFVGIPVPGTGAWMGALIAALLNMDPKKTFPVIAVGVLTAGIIVSVLSFGVLGSIF